MTKNNEQMHSMSLSVELDKSHSTATPLIIDGVDVSKGNQKYAAKSSPVEDWYKAKVNTVDGINLAECVHFTRQFDYGYCDLSNDSCNEFQYNCVKNKNCYFKQFKRKEQECEELKAHLEEESKLGHKAIQDEADTFFNLLKVQKELDQLKKENEILKNFLKEESCNFDKIKDLVND